MTSLKHHCNCVKGLRDCSHIRKSTSPKFLKNSISNSSHVSQFLYPDHENKDPKCTRVSRKRGTCWHSLRFPFAPVGRFIGDPGVNRPPFIIHRNRWSPLSLREASSSRVPSAAHWPTCSRGTGLKRQEELSAVHLFPPSFFLSLTHTHTHTHTHTSRGTPSVAEGPSLHVRVLPRSEGVNNERRDDTRATARGSPH